MSFVPQTIYRESREIKKKKINYPYKTDKAGLSFFAVLCSATCGILIP